MGNFEFAYSVAGGDYPPGVHDFPVAASQTLKVGDLVQLSSGQVVKSTASAASPLGVMAQSSTGADAGTMVRVYPILSGQVWRAKASASAASAVLGSRKYDITSAQLVDISDDTNGSILIIKLGATNTDVYVAFTRSALVEIGS